MKTKFSTISSIDLKNESSWKIPSFITFDIDWCHDDILKYTIELLEYANVCVTWFITHDTPLLDRLRDNPKFDLGIHPNFNFLLQGESKNGKNAEEVVNRLMKIVPEALSVRSHSMTQSSVLLDMFYDNGIRYDCNHFIPAQGGINLKPYRLWNNLIKVPYFWEDDIALLYDDPTILTQLSNKSGIKVFDFHPIHVFLNTESIDRYERTRPMHQKPKELIKYRFEGYGTRNKLMDLLAMVSNL